MRKLTVVLQIASSTLLITAIAFLFLFQKATYKIINEYDEIFTNSSIEYVEDENPTPKGTVAIYFESLDEDRTEYTFYNKKGQVLEVRIIELTKAQKEWREGLKLALSKKEDSPLPSEVKENRISVVKVNEHGEKLAAFSGWIGESYWVEKINMMLAS